ncbi:MAG: FTR1 family iron permease [Chloroflexi bacterium]|nr:FTR1 family iron permease [Chloroflexota bacterium]
MIGSLIITTREGLEASLIIGIILAYLARTGHHGYTRAVWAGAATAIAISVTIGAAIFVTVGELTETSEQVVEGAAMLLAAAVLSYTVIWMRHQASGLSATLQSQVSNAVGTGSGLALFILALVAVLREGVETALFLFAAASASSSKDTLIGGLVGLGVAVALGYAVYTSSNRLNLRAFFNVSGFLLIFFAAGLLVHGLHELQEAALLPAVGGQAWDLGWFLSDEEGPGIFLKALFGYISDPSLGEVTVYTGYLAAALWYYLGRRPEPAPGRSRRAAKSGR